MQIPKKLEPPENRDSKELEQAYKQILLDKVATSDKIKQQRKLLDTAETRHKQVDDGITEWRVNSLLPYAQLCVTEGKIFKEQARVLLHERQQQEAKQRTELGLSLGKLLDNESAGHDLCTLFIRMAKGYINDDTPAMLDKIERRISYWGNMIDTARATIADIEALKDKPLDSKQALRKNKQNLLANLENQNTETDEVKGE